MAASYMDGLLVAVVVWRELEGIPSGTLCIKNAFPFSVDWKKIVDTIDVLTVATRARRREAFSESRGGGEELQNVSRLFYVEGK